MGAALVASIASAIYCLWSPLYFRPSAVVDRLRATSKARNERRSSTANPPGVMWFFQLVSVLDRAGFRTTLAAVDASFEIDVLASRITALSANVRRKHLAANIGFALAALTLMLFAASALTYVVAVTAAR